MGKRAHAEGVTGSSTIDSPSFKKAKRSKDEAGAFAVLLENADDLINCLQTLKSSSGTDARTCNTGRLAALSKKLLPALKVISKTDNASENAESLPPSVPSQQKPETTAQPSIPPNYTNRVPPLALLPAWTTAEIPTEHPPLPPIANPALEKMALLHHGMRSHSWETSYETLEFIGDSFIYFVVCELISQTFPLLGPGPCSQLRERLVCNANLSKYSLHYGLDKRARLPKEFIGNGREDEGGSKSGEKERQKVLGDLFEAYVGGLVHASPDGTEVAIRWLRPLWAMTLSKEIRREYRRREALPADALVVPKEAIQDGELVALAVKPAKVRLAGLICCKGVVIRYEDMPNHELKHRENKKLNVFTVGVWVDAWGKSELLGCGTALSKKDAGGIAAEKALENKKRMKFYVDKKKAYLEAQAAQEELGI